MKRFSHHNDIPSYQVILNDLHSHNITFFLNNVNQFSKFLLIIY